MYSIQSKSILNKTKRRDPWFLDDYTINPYSGCSFNCTYCYIRGSKYGEHMEERLAWKENAPLLLEKALALRSRKNQHGIIVLSSATDPYLQWEKELKLTRTLLEIILHFRFPVHIITKSNLVERDFDLLQKIDEQAILPSDLAAQTKRGVFITFSFSTLRNQVASHFESGATPPDQRLAALRHSLQAGFHAGVSLMPLIPHVTDSQDELNHMFKHFYETGTRYLFCSTLTLFGREPFDSFPLTRKTIARHYPEMLESFDKLFREVDAMSTYQRVIAQRVSKCRSGNPIPEFLI